MRRFLPWILWLGILLIVVQTGYFFLKSSPKDIRHDEGTPLRTVRSPIAVKSLNCVISDGSDGYWLGTNGEGVCRYKANGEMKIFTLSDGLIDDCIISLALDSSRNLWAGTARHGVSFYDGSQWKNYDVAEGPIGERIFAIRIDPVDASVWMATSGGVSRYQPKTERWNHYTRRDHLPEDQVNDLVFDSQGDLYLGTASCGIVQMERNEAGEFHVTNVLTAPDRFGTEETPTISCVPTKALGTGLPSNRINRLLITHDGTLWAATDTGLAWSRNRKDDWQFLRGRDYGDKMRGLVAGTPPGWQEVPRKRFGELLPEDDLTALAQDTGGGLWIGTRSLGSVHIKPESFYTKLGNQEEPVDQETAFLETMATISKRFFGRSTDEIVAIVPGNDRTVLLAGRNGTIEMATSPFETITSSPVQQVSPKVKTDETVETSAAENAPSFEAEIRGLIPQNLEFANNVTYPYAAYYGEDWKTRGNWYGIYGKQYALIGGADGAWDRLVAFDETKCQIRVFSGNIGNRTRPVERIILPIEEKSQTWSLLPQDKERTSSFWRLAGNIVPHNYDGPHLWLSVELKRPGLWFCTLYFIDSIKYTMAMREDEWIRHDYLVEVYPRDSFWDTNLGWEELAKRSEEYASITPPLAKTRVQNFSDGVHKRFVMVGPGSYLIRIDKNFGLPVELAGVMVDPALPNGSRGNGADFSAKTPSVVQPKSPETLAVLDLWSALDYQIQQVQDVQNQRFLRIMAEQFATSVARRCPDDSAAVSLKRAIEWQIPLWPADQYDEWQKWMENNITSKTEEQTSDNIPE